MKNAPTNSDDVIDSRDILARIEELQGMDAPDEEEKEELAALESLQSEAEGYSDDWKHGASLVRDSYFTEYVEELCRDIGDMPAEIPHYIEIDWEKTAANIQQDYTSIEFDGVTYWVR